MTEPALYFSNLMMVDKENNQLLGMLLDDRAISKSKENAMSALFTYGCTCVFNHKALEAFTRISDSRKYIYFDDWMFAVCVFNGSVYYDSESHIRYRQTGENVSGEKKFGFGLWLQRFGKLFRLNKDMRIRESIAIELIDKFEKELTETDLKFLEMIADYRRKFSHKINLIFSKRMRTNSKMRNICTVGRIVIGHL
jgi:rhamnosyltransferase